MQVNWKSGGQPEVQVWLCLGQIIKPSGYDFLIRYEGGRVALNKQQGYLYTLKMSLHVFWISFFSFVASSLSLFASSNEAWSFFSLLILFFVFGFQKFYNDVPRCSFIYIYPVEVCMQHVSNLWLNFFHQLWKIISLHVASTPFFFSLLFLPGLLLNMCVPHVYYAHFCIF